MMKQIRNLAVATTAAAVLATGALPRPAAASTQGTINTLLIGRRGGRRWSHPL